MKATSHHHVITGTLYAGAILFLAAGASAQNLYVEADPNSPASEIVEYSSGGTPSTFDATGLDYADGMAFDSAGNLFIANTADNNGESGYITKITPGGTPSTFASGIDPHAIAFNSAGDLFEADYHSGNVYEYAPTGGAPSLVQGGFSEPLTLAFNSAGDLFVSAGYGAGNGYITEIMPGGGSSTFATGLTFPTGLAFNSAGDLFVSNQGTGVIDEFAPGGGTPSVFATLPETDLDGIAFDNSGDLFVATGNSGKIVEVSPDGSTQSTFATIPSGDEFAAGLAFAPVPEPSVLALLAIGASAMAIRLRRKV